MKLKHSSLATACFCALGVAAIAHAQSSTSIAFVTHAESIEGIVQHYNSDDVLVAQEVINRQGEASTDTFGSNTENTSSTSSDALGITLYSITTGQNSTTGCNNTSGCDQTSATASASTVNLLNGLVEVTVQATSFAAIADATNPDQVDITTASASAATIGGTGVSVAAGTYSSGTSFPVSGHVNVPVLNAQGQPTGTMQQETFTGHLVLAQVLQGSDPTTGASVITFTAEQLIGQVSDGAGGSYSITLGGPITPPSPGGSGPTFSMATTPTFHVSG